MSDDPKPEESGTSDPDQVRLGVLNAIERAIEGADPAIQLEALATVAARLGASQRPAEAYAKRLRELAKAARDAKAFSAAAVAEQLLRTFCCEENRRDLL